MSAAAAAPSGMPAGSTASTASASSTSSAWSTSTSGSAPHEWPGDRGRRPFDRDLRPGVTSNSAWRTVVGLFMLSLAGRRRTVQAWERERPTLPRHARRATTSSLVEKRFNPHRDP